MTGFEPMTRHTPAPWLIEPHTYGRFDAYIVSETGTLARVFRHGDNLAIDEECEANARLISVAPDLLEALIEMTSRCSAMQSSQQGVFIQSYKAIAKATGELK